MGGQTVHTVQSGEWLGRIAQRYGVTAEDVRLANGGLNPDLIYPGQELVIPAASKANRWVSAANGNGHHHASPNGKQWAMPAKDFRQLSNAALSKKRGRPVSLANPPVALKAVTKFIAIAKKKDSKRVLLKKAKEFGASKGGMSRYSRLMTISPGTIYFLVLENSWLMCFTMAMLCYVIIIMISASLALSVTLENSTEDREGDVPHLILALRFAASNVVSMGFGTVTPVDDAGFFLGTFQQLAGIIVNVFVFAFVLAKFQSPQADIIFSKTACVATRNGQPFLMIRVGNLRCHTMFSVSISLNLFQRQVTSEGEVYMKIEALEVVPPATMSGVYTITHKVDEASPLHGLTQAKLAEKPANEFMLQCVFQAYDPIYQADVCSKVVFGPSNIKFNHKYVKASPPIDRAARGTTPLTPARPHARTHSVPSTPSSYPLSLSFSPLFSFFPSPEQFPPLLLLLLLLRLGMRT